MRDGNTYRKKGVWVGASQCFVLFAETIFLLVKQIYVSKVFFHRNQQILFGIYIYFSDPKYLFFWDFDEQCRKYA